MSNIKSELIAEDSRSFEEHGKEDEEGFYSLSHSREEDFTSASSSSQHRPQTWSPFDDLDDSGHFTASPDVEIALSGSSRGHSPCPSSAHLVLQMQHLDSESVVNSQHPLHLQQEQHQQCQSLQQQQTNKPLISPRSVMTVKVPQSIPPALVPSSSDNHSSDNNNERGCWQTQSSSRPETCVINRAEMAYGLAFASSPHLSTGASFRPPVLPASALLGNRGDASSIHEDGLPKDESCEYLRSILVNFNSLYMEKLRMVDDLAAEGSDEQKKLLMEKKTNMLENWAKDVCVHNMVLVHTVEELEREANRKVSALQKKMTESTQLAKEHMTMIKKYEEQVKLLLKDHSDTEERNLVLKIELEKVKSECRRVRDRMNMLLKDNESLLTLVCRIRDMGVWDIDGLELQRSSYEQIFGLYPNLRGNEVQTVFTRDKAQRVEDTEKRVVELEEQLYHLQQSQKEAESCVMLKDRKIEELEMEIKNVLNKAHYCEKECNDYKRSLLETQEKLLEATKRLTQSSTRPLKGEGPGEIEMAELLKELRDVKSQLNTAVEEKHSAREESSYFKRELSERLKEMHDIQNVFQNLATEVVTSRAAFQQVQEKEVQLQSLKSEVHTYQSRCADAEDTIRKKEKEIKRLQRQMNEIHIRRETATAPASAPSLYSKEDSFLTSKQSSLKPSSRKNYAVPSSAPGPRPLTRSNPKPRNVYSQSRIPIHVKSTMGKQQKFQTIVNPTWHHNGSGDRPPWNTHFKKSTGILSQPPPALPVVPKKQSQSRSQSALIRGSLAITEQGLDNMELDCKDIFQKLTDLERQMSESRVSIDSSVQKTQSAPAMEPKKIEKLPKIASHNFKREQKQPPQTSPAYSGLKAGRLPIVHDPRIHSSRGKTSPRRPVVKIPLQNIRSNSATPSPRMNALISAVVETSNMLLDGGPASTDDPTEDKLPDRRKSYIVTASHHRTHRSNKDYVKSDVRRAKSSEKYATPKHGNLRNSNKDTEKSAKTIRSSTDITKKHDDGSNTDEAMNVVFESPRNVGEYLSKLPEDSCENLVKTWIRKSSSHSVTEDINHLKNTKSLPIRGRQSSVRVMKHLATRREPPPKNSSAKSFQSSELTAELESEMFELEEEWGKVFANLEYNTHGAAGERTDTSKTSLSDADMDLGTEGEKPIGPTKTKSLSAIAQDHTVTTTTNSSNETSNAQSNAHDNSEQSNATKCQEKESIEELLNRLTTEKREMEERYRKELEDKNVELKMQKMTIQHLQDAYVALKRGQPIPVPQSVTGNKTIANGNGSSNGHHKTNNNNNNSQILDV